MLRSHGYQKCKFFICQRLLKSRKPCFRRDWYWKTGPDLRTLYTSVSDINSNNNLNSKPVMLKTQTDKVKHRPLRMTSVNLLHNSVFGKTMENVKVSES